MGSSLSTRWKGHRRKLCVSELIAIPIGRLAGTGFAVPCKAWIIDDVVTTSDGGVYNIRMVFIGYKPDHIECILQVMEPATGNSGEYAIILRRQSLDNGVGDWLAECPHSNPPRRARILYLDRALVMLGCRQCHHLVYPSSHHVNALDPIKKAMNDEILVRVKGMKKLLLDGLWRLIISEKMLVNDDGGEPEW